MYKKYSQKETVVFNENQMIILHIYKNGDSRFPGRKVTLIPTNYRTWKDFLAYLDNILHAQENIIEIRTLSGSIIRRLEQLNSDQSYIAIQRGEIFQKLNYSEHEEVKHDTRQNETKGGRQVNGLQRCDNCYFDESLNNHIEERTPNFPIRRENNKRRFSLEEFVHKQQNEKEAIPAESSKKKENNHYTELFSYIDKNAFGKDTFFKGPFGNRPIIYCDYTASGRPLKFLEEYIFQEVLPTYSNTHTTNTIVSMQTTIFRQEARNIIRKACNATEKDVVIFTGNGCTGAIHKLIYNLKHLNAPIVIMGPFEHHSNLLPWRHMAKATYRIKTDENGALNVNDLHSVLKCQSKIALRENRQLIGVFAAVSNITGILTDVNIVSSIVHKYNGIVFWDYATGAPYVDINMNPNTSGSNDSGNYKDAVYFSMHKFIGGVQSPGILIAKKFLFTAGERDPHGAGGGTVFLVNRKNHIYLKEIEEREEGGTPNIIGDIRAGLVFQLKELITSDAIIQREKYIIEYTKSKLECTPNIYILGDFKTERVAILSFVIRQNVSENRFLFLHHNFVCSLLNDLFGIQSRSGCACAGPYAADLLGIDEEMTELFTNLLSGLKINNITNLKEIPDFPRRAIFKPGFVRINIPFFMPDNEIDYVLNAIKFVSENGYKFLSIYKFSPNSDDWKHNFFNPINNMKFLKNISYQNGSMEWEKLNNGILNENKLSFEEILKENENILNQIIKNPISIPDETNLFEESVQCYRWFLLPSEAAYIISNYPKVSKFSKSLFYPGSLIPAFSTYNANR